MRKTGTYAATSLRLFQDKTKGPKKCTDTLSEMEKLWISKSSTGPMIWSEGYEGNAIQYDVNEFYPSVLIQKGAKWPVKPGKFVKLISLERKLPYGIYNAEIEGQPKKKDDPHCTKLFRYN